MASFFQVGPQCIQDAQQNLETWVTVPKDAVWGCTKSMLASFVVTSLYTHGNIFAGVKAAAAASIASTVHTTAMAAILKAVSAYGVDEQPRFEGLGYVSHAVSLFGFFVSYVFGRKMGASLWLSLPATTLPYFLTQSQTSTRTVTPLFVTVVS